MPYSVLDCTCLVFGQLVCGVKGKNQVITHRSTITFTRGNLPPFLDVHEVFPDFKKLFHFKSEFEAWESHYCNLRLSLTTLASRNLWMSLSCFHRKLDKLNSPTNFGLKQINYKFFTVIIYTFRRSIRPLDQIYWLDRGRENIYIYIEKRFKDLWNSDETLNEQVFMFIRHTGEVRALDFILKAPKGVLMFLILVVQHHPSSSVQNLQPIVQPPKPI